MGTGPGAGLRSPALGLGTSSARQPTRLTCLIPRETEATEKWRARRQWQLPLLPCAPPIGKIRSFPPLPTRHP